MAARTKAQDSNNKLPHNAESVLEIIRTKGPSSQAAIARATDLSPATITSIIRGLRERGVVEVRATNGREVEVAFAAGTGFYVVAEVANDFIEATLFDFENSRELMVADHTSSDPKALKNLIEALAGTAGISASQLSAIAIALRAPIEKSSSTIAKWCNLRMPGWAGFDLSTLKDLLPSGVPVLVENDANLAALAEWTFGVGKGANDFLYVRASEGVGGGIILNGRIFHGSNGMAGNIGHMTLDGNGEVCECGSRGCLSTVIATRKILGAVSAIAGDRKTIEDVIQAANDGDAASHRVLEEAGSHLGQVLANASKLIAPRIIAIGGDLGRAGSHLFDSLLGSPEFSKVTAASGGTAVLPAQLGADAAKFGGLVLSMEAAGRGLSELPNWFIV